ANEAVGEGEGSYVWEDHFYPESLDPETGDPLPDGQDGVLVITTLTTEALPLPRFRTGDITSRTREVGPGGRTHARIGMIRGRTDDMLIVRGVNLYPTQIEAALQHVPEASAHYQLVVKREKTLDEIELRLELDQATFAGLGITPGDDGALPGEDRVERPVREVQHKIRDVVGIGVKVTLLAPGAAPRSAGGKLRRIQDERKL